MNATFCSKLFMKSYKWEAKIEEKSEPGSSRAVAKCAIHYTTSQCYYKFIYLTGSMTGLRKEIAKHVVLNILETLGEDDFVTIYKFSKVPTPLVECFTVDGRAELVQVTTFLVRF